MTGVRGSPHAAGLLHLLLVQPDADRVVRELGGGAERVPVLIRAVPPRPNDGVGEIEGGRIAAGVAHEHGVPGLSSLEVDHVRVLAARSAGAGPVARSRHGEGGWGWGGA